MLLDITRPVHETMALYPDNPAVEFELVRDASAGGSALTRITLGSHTGTHIDAPSHIVAGAQGTGLYDLEQMNGPAVVVAVSDVAGTITAVDIPETVSSGVERVLLKTSNSAGDRDVFDPDFVAFDESAAQTFVERGVRLVGIDALSVKRRGVQDRVHQILLDAGIVILEGLWLADVLPGQYELLCLPLRVDLDGAPARAVLRTLTRDE